MENISNRLLTVRVSVGSKFDWLPPLWRENLSWLLGLFGFPTDSSVHMLVKDTIRQILQARGHGEMMAPLPQNIVQ